MPATDLVFGLKTVIPESRLSNSEDEVHVLGNGGRISVFPQTEQEISDVLSYANESGQTVSIMGAGTKRGYGGLIEHADILLSMKEYSGIVEHVPGDMTVTAKAGTSFGELQQYLSQYNQRVSIDPFTPRASTIGGVIAANDSGPRRLGYGSARDSVIGLRVVYPNGTIIRAGGKVVKNVAGYDMNKLFIGSMGTLGLLSEVTFKLRPSPKSESLVLLSFPDGSMEQIRQIAVNLLDSMLEPVALELLSPALAEQLTGKCSHTLAISLEDVESAVLYQENEIKNMMPPNANIEIFSAKKAQSFWEQFYEQTEEKASAELKAVVKIGVVNLDALSIFDEAIRLESNNLLQLKAHGGLGHGLCRIIVKGEEKKVLDAISRLREKAEVLGGYAIVTHLPYAFRKKLDVWGPKPSYFSLMEGVKRTIDPNGILNRKRFVGGI